MSSRTSSSFEKLMVAAISFPLRLGARLVDDLPANLATAKGRLEAIFSNGEPRPDEQRRAEVPTRERPGGEAKPTTRASSGTMPLDIATSDDDDVDHLALADYDQSAASHLISKFSGLTADELDAIEAYEVAHRGRRTILGKIDQIRAER